MDPFNISYEKMVQSVYGIILQHDIDKTLHKSVRCWWIAWRCWI